MVSPITYASICDRTGCPSFSLHFTAIGEFYERLREAKSPEFLHSLYHPQIFGYSVQDAWVVFEVSESSRPNFWIAAAFA